MHNLAVAVEGFSSALDIAFLSSGVESLACASLLAAAGQQVQLRGHDRLRPTSLIHERADRLGIPGTQLLHFAPLLQEADGYVRSPDILMVHGRAADYNEALNIVANDARAGQTLFIIDAPLLTAFELGQRLDKLGKQLSVNIIETGPLFHSCKVDNSIVYITAATSQVSICGRTINETRAGLSIGRTFWKDLVPASNVIERRLAHGNPLLGAAQRLFAVMSAQRGQECASKEPSTLTSAEQSIIASMRNELQTLGKQFNISVPQEPPFSQLSESLQKERDELATLVRQDLVLVSDLAKLAYISTPTIDSIIELAGVTLGRDLRREGRTLEDLGLIGMDFHEIFELINS